MNWVAVQVAFDVLFFAWLIVALMLAYRALNLAKQALQKQPEKKKKILVPGRGVFTQPKARKTPKYWTDLEIWQKEQDEKRR
jgi:hypothetical protein